MPARVKSVGAIATILDIEQIPGRPKPPEASPDAVIPVNVLLRPFAKLVEGILAISPGSTTVGIDPERISELEEFVRTQLGLLPTLPSEFRHSQWASVVEELEKLNVKTDAETLLNLDFDLVPDGELRARLVGDTG